MLIKRLTIRNYKSLKEVDLAPTPLCALVGPNGAGKSNFASALDFLADVYRHGLEVAVTRKGGYENIAFRRQRRSKSAIRFEVTLQLSPAEFHPVSLYSKASALAPKDTVYRVTHGFSFRAQSQAIGAEFRVEDESLEIWAVIPTHRTGKHRKRVLRLAGVVRSEGGALAATISRSTLPGGRFLGRLRSEIEHLKKKEGSPGQQQLAFGAPWTSYSYCGSQARQLANCRVFQFAPPTSRASGVPTPNPTLSMSGENLPAIVAWLQDHHEPQWRVVIEAMREIVPGLEHIDVDYLHTKRLGLLFKEEASTRPWGADDVSDGTIRALALLVALVDPGNTALVIEELENSVHPWIIKVVLERLRKVSEQKSVILTTHSPVLIDVLAPNETWIVYKKAGETKLKNIVDIDPTVATAWEGGEFRLSDYLDSGLLPQAVPGGEL